MIDADDDADEVVRIRVLGAVTATFAGRDVDLGGPRARALLAALVVARGSTLSADALLRDVWGEPTPGRRSSLRATVSRLRGTALAPHLVGGRQGYALSPGPSLDVDLWRAADVAAGIRSATAGDLADLALPWSRPFDGTGDSPFLSSARTLAQAVVRRAVLRVTDGHDADPRARAALDRVIAREPDDPELRARRLTLLAVDSAGAGAAGGALAGATRRVGVPAPIAAYWPRPEDEARLAAALRVSRLVTLVGPSGVGKTRLSIEWARGPAGSGQEHVWFCRMGARASAPSGAAAGDWLRDVARVVEADDDTAVAVAERLKHLHGTLVLDGWDDASHAAPSELANLLERAPGVRVIVTARRPLGVPGESVHRVEPLSAADARALFELRGGSARPSSDPAAVDALIDALGRLPLAIELAAARAAQLPLASVVDVLAPAAARGEGPLARALTSTLDQLSGAERGLLTRLCVFRGAFSDDSAAALADGEVKAGLDALVGWALVAAETRGSQRLLRVPEVVRRHLGTAPGEASAVRARHARWFARRTLQAFRELTTADAAGAGERLETERADIDAAFEFAVATSDRASALGIAAGRTWLSLSSGTQAAALALARRAAGVPGEAPSDLEARAGLGRGILAYQLASMSEARTVLDAALAASLEAGEPELIALSHSFLAYLATLRPDGGREAVRRIDAGRALLGDVPPDTRAMVTLITAQVERSRGDLSRARAAAEHAGVLARQSGHGWVQLMSGVVAAKVRIDARDAAGALTVIRRVLDEPQVHADPISVLIASSVAAGAAAGVGADAAGARIIGAVEAIGPRFSFDPRANEPADFVAYRRRVRQGLTAEAWRDAYAHGARLTVAGLVDHVQQIRRA